MSKKKWTVEALLDTYHSDVLRAMVAHFKVSAGDKKLLKKDMIRLLAEEGFTAEGVRARYARLTDDERRIFDRLREFGETGQRTPRLKREMLLREWVDGNEDRWVSGRTYNGFVEHVVDLKRQDSLVFEDVLGRLTFEGLVFGEAEGASYKLMYQPELHVFVPDFVNQHLPAPAPAPAVLANWKPDWKRGGNANQFLRDLYLYWDYVRQNSVKLLKAGGVGKRDMKGLAEIMLGEVADINRVRKEEEADYLYKLRQQLTRLGLIEVAGTHLVINEKASNAFWGQTTVALWRSYLAQGWGPTMEANEGNYYWVQFQEDWGAQAVINYLKQHEVGVWLDRDAVYEGVEEMEPNFLIKNYEQIKNGEQGYHFNNYQRNYILAELAEIEEMFVIKVLIELTWAGMVELGGKGEPEALFSAVRLTPLGGAVLGDAAWEMDEGQVIVQPNFQILAMGPVSLKILAQLDGMAERQKADEAVFEYQLTKESVYQAQQYGYDVPAIISFVEEVSGLPMPQNVRRSLREWQGQQERIVFYQGVTVVQTTDEGVLAALMAEVEGDVMVTPKVGLVPKEQYEEMLGALLAAGQMPAVGGLNAESADNCMVIDEEGVVEMVHAVPHLYAESRVAAVATAEGNGRWRLQADKVAKIGNSRRKVEKLLDELGQLSRQPLAAKLIQKVKAWGNYYGPVTVDRPILLSFQDQETLAELMVDEILGALLARFEAGERALATVAEGDLKEVEARLAELGVTLKTTIG
ncbi:MAG TPA: helicase-associated domain-containing protein [Anaerolineae bacterium]|nr:helicase-associated domain-containing protein [Anaerolineae bacterium]